MSYGSCCFSSLSVSFDRAISSVISGMAGCMERHAPCARAAVRIRNAYQCRIVALIRLRLVFSLDLGYQPLTQFFVRYLTAGGDDQIALSPGWHISSLCASVTVGVKEIFHRHARHQEALQDAVFDDGNFARRHAFIVIAV